MNENKKADYYSEVGSYRGAIKHLDQWISVNQLNLINKNRLVRWQGPPNQSIINAMKQKPLHADEFLPHLKTIRCPFCEAGFPTKEVSNTT